MGLGIKIAYDRVETHLCIGTWIKGEKSLLYSRGLERSDSMKSAQISRNDLLEARKERCKICSRPYVETSLSGV